jgi:hypothetical protein
VAPEARGKILSPLSGIEPSTELTFPNLFVITARAVATGSARVREQRGLIYIGRTFLLAFYVFPIDVRFGILHGSSCVPLLCD